MRSSSLISLAINLVLLSALRDSDAADQGRGSDSLELGQLLGKIHQQEGIEFKVHGSLSHDLLKAPLHEDVKPDLSRILKGYNWIGVRDVSGTWRMVVVTGRNGDGGIPKAAYKSALIRYRQPPAHIPIKYQGLPKGAVYPIDLSTDLLRNMSLGEKLVLTLPSGDHTLVHDRAWDHPNGDKTWVGREIVDKGLNRTLITLGDHNQVDGQIVTPGGNYLVESDESGQWLIDIKASGLQLGSFDHGGIPPMIPAVAGTTIASGTSITASTNQAPGFASGAAAAHASQIDLLLLYADDLPSENPMTRMNSLVAFANQALVDSRISIQFNILGVRKVNYSHEASNLVALNQLTAAQDAFNAVPQLRENEGADLILLIRPFRPSSEDQSCGDAWINGGNGSGLSPDLAFGVVNEGRAGGFYCSNYTLAHELGHLLGAAHDRSHATSGGHFTYSYGYGINGLFGDIMSYFSPEVGVYATPEITECFGQKCGVPAGKPDEADVAATLRATGPVVAKFSTQSTH